MWGKVVGVFLPVCLLDFCAPSGSSITCERRIRTSSEKLPTWRYPVVHTLFVPASHSGEGCPPKKSFPKSGGGFPHSNKYGKLWPKAGQHHPKCGISGA